MKRILSFAVSALLMACAAFTACNNEDKQNPQEPEKIAATGVEFVDANGNAVSEITVEEGADAGVKYRFIPKGSIGEVDFAYSDERIAVYKEGVEALWPGKATVTATLKGTEQSAKLIVNIKLAPAKKEITPEGSRHTGIDLGLTSGTLWADGNLGYDGEYQEYAMGKWYYWDLIESPSDNKFTQEYYTGKIPMDISEDISGSIHDPAAMNWGGNWRMPTRAQFEELMKECSWKSGTANDGMFKGYWVKGPNGKQIFLPYSASCDYRGWTRDFNNHDYGCYWSSTPAGAGLADYLYFNQYNDIWINMGSYGPGVKYSGHSIRPVMPAGGK